MILLEQFINGIPDGLAIWLKEKKAESLSEAPELPGTPCKGQYQETSEGGHTLGGSSSTSQSCE